MQGSTEFVLTFDEIESIYREGWRAGASFNGDHSDEIGALEVENEAWEESCVRRTLFEKEKET